MKTIWRFLFVPVGLALAVSQFVFADDLSASYQWKPVRIGAGGYVVGLVLHPLDPAVRYARTDVGNAYRWDEPAQQWIPMRVLNVDGSGIQSAAATSSPSGYGVESIAVDPSDKSVVYLVFPTTTSCDVQCPVNSLEIYKSSDGGRNFTPGKMTAAAIAGNPNGAHRSLGERLNVDPANPMVLYFGSESQGLYRSIDGGQTWKQLAGASAPPANIEVIDTLFAAGSGTVTLGNQTVTGTLYSISVNNTDAGGDVYRSIDGGATWSDISTGVIDPASGVSLSHQALAASIDSQGALYVAENAATNGYRRAYWRYAAGKWSRVSLEGFISQPLVSVAADPSQPQRIYALGEDTGLSRSDDAGVTWISFGSAQYANTFAWLPQTVGMAAGEWHSNGGLKMDSAGNLWTPTGQEGILMIASADAAAATAGLPPRWKILSSGIEEMVAQDIVIPPGSSDTIIATAEDTTGFVISNPDNFSAVQIPLQQEIVAQGTSVDYAPDAPGYLAVTSSNVAANGPNYSGYSSDGGRTWTRFGPALQYNCGINKCDTPAGDIAVSARGGRSLGSDHIVLYPPEGLAPQYSRDGGATWQVTASFPLNSDGMTIGSPDYSSFLFPELSQHLLRADPFVPDKFYLKFTHAPQPFYISTDGGVTWQGRGNANLPDWAWHGQLAVNGKLKNDLWYADGWEGSTVHGIFHSTDGGETFQQVAGISHAITIAVGAGSGRAGDAAFAVYFYGQMAGDPKWGIFRSTNSGSSWDRISQYPTGIYDRPNTMAASQDTFGKVYLGLSGNSFVYGELIPAGPALPGAPSGLRATAVSGSEIDLSWNIASGTIASYNVFRGAAQGQEAATPLAAGITGVSYADKKVAAGMVYYYTVAAVNAVGQGAASNEAVAQATQPALKLAIAAGGNASATVTSGGTATFSLVLNSTNYAGTVTFACTGAPVGDLCVVPSSVTVITTATATPVAVSVTTSSGAAAASNKAMWVVLLGGSFVFAIRRKRRWMQWIPMLSIGFLMMGLGCGSSSTTRVPAVSTLTVTATAPGLPVTTQQLTLTVQ